MIIEEKLKYAPITNKTYWRDARLPEPYYFNIKNNGHEVLYVANNQTIHDLIKANSFSIFSSIEGIQIVWNFRLKI